jgi:DNA-binding transcriptional ArsR family regulator
MEQQRLTDGLAGREPLGPPLIGALLRMPVDAVRRQIIERLHARGFADIDEAHLTLLRSPGPQGERPSDLAAQLGMTKQALNYQLGQLERRLPRAPARPRGPALPADRADATRRCRGPRDP